MKYKKNFKENEEKGDLDGGKKETRNCRDCKGSEITNVYWGLVPARGQV